MKLNTKTLILSLLAVSTALSNASGFFQRDNSRFDVGNGTESNSWAINDWSGLLSISSNTRNFGEVAFSDELVFDDFQAQTASNASYVTLEFRYFLTGSIPGPLQFKSFTRNSSTSTLWRYNKITIPADITAGEYTVQMSISTRCPGIDERKHGRYEATFTKLAQEVIITPIQAEIKTSTSSLISFPSRVGSFYNIKRGRSLEALEDAPVAIAGTGEVITRFFVSESNRYFFATEESNVAHTALEPATTQTSEAVTILP